MKTIHVDVVSQKALMNIILEEIRQIGKLYGPSTAGTVLSVLSPWR